MSLTTHLKDRDFIWEAVLEAAPVLAGNEGKFVLGYDKVSTLQLYCPGMALQHASISGTAFDLLARKLITGTWDPMAYRGLEYALLETDNQSLKAIVDWAINTTELEKAAVIMALMAVIVRAGPIVFQSKFYGGFYKQTTIPGFLEAIGETVPNDLKGLRTHSEDSIATYSNALSFQSGPTFAGSMLVDGADADFVVDGKLVELKTTGVKLAPGKIKEFLTQAVGYCLLDFEDEYMIRAVDIWLPRYKAHFEFRLEDLIRGELQKARSTFKDSVSSEAYRVRDNFNAIQSYYIPDKGFSRSVLEKWGVPIPLQNGWRKKLALSSVILESNKHN
jgi:hypothetical protein